MRTIDLETELDLEKAADEFVKAGRKYGEFLKRNYPDRLAAVVWICDESGESVMYSENRRYTSQIAMLTHDTKKDVFELSDKEQKE